MNYIDLWKNIIAQSMQTYSLNKEQLDKLYENEKANVQLAGKLSRLPEVDEKTLFSYFTTARNEYLSVNPIDPGISHSLTKDGFKSWLDTERNETINWNYSERYFDHLLKSGRSPKVVDETRRSSYSILGKMADPKSKSAIYNKGLVVGSVQSGKTGNFNAVINRAIDSGYVLIIVLSGIMEDLRSQTQKRIESDVIGEGKIDSSETSGIKGVGKIRRFGVAGKSDVVQVKTLTSENKDFGKTAEELDHTLNDKYVLVCKKNVSVLKNLIVWLHNSLEKNKEKHNIPLLIIDDEADNASLNNMGAKGREYASKTNGHIRAILEMFHVKSYLGYTATPFANVLQDRNEKPEREWPISYKFKGEDKEKLLKQVDNIFPDDFIELLDPPSNYVGAKQIFETIAPIYNNTEDNEKIPLVAPVVNDYIEEFPSRIYEDDDGEIRGLELIRSKSEWESRFGFGGYLGFSTYSEYRKETWSPRKENDFPKKLPESLKVAVKCYILALAIRESRKPKMVNSKLNQIHNTMLIHTSRFTFWQNKTSELVKSYLNELITRINNDNPSSENSIYFELEKLWYSNYGYAHIVEHIKDYLPKGYEDEFMSPLVFDSLKPILVEAVKDIEVKAINSFTKESLEYPKNAPKKYIAIGGNRLSRGFTLEGLTINYFIRVTNYSDALLQMGRWFGYRPGYLDCCKIFTTQDSLDKFNSTTKCIEELESEFIKMESQDKTPKNFVLRVKKHPDTLKITRPSILKNATEVRWSFQDSLEMTTNIKVDPKSISDIWNVFKNNIAPSFKKWNEKKDIVYYDTSGEEIIQLLRKHPNNFEDSEFLAKYIELTTSHGYLNSWRVGLKISGSVESNLSISDLNLNSELGITEVKFAKRSGPKSKNKYNNDVSKFLEEGIFKASGRSANIISSNEDMTVWLSPNQIELAKSNFYKNKAEEQIRKSDSTLSFDDALFQVKEKYTTIPERYYREQMNENQGLLMIYLIDSKSAFNQLPTDKNNHIEDYTTFGKYITENNINTDIPLIGYVIEFPPIENDPGAVYLQGDYELDLDEGDDIETEEDEFSVITELDE